MANMPSAGDSPVAVWEIYWKLAYADVSVTAFQRRQS
jgi:hypothetical protein